MTAPHPAPIATAPRALVVSAARPFLRSLTIRLRSAGWIVKSAPTGPDALGLVADDPPHVLVLDLERPVGDGLELVRVLAERRGRPVTDRQLLQAGWGNQRRAETHRLRVTVARLRDKLERDLCRPAYLIAEPGIGYRLCSRGEVSA